MKKIWKIVIAVLISLLLISIILLVSNRYGFGANTDGNKIPLDVNQSEERLIEE